MKSKFFLRAAACILICAGLHASAQTYIATTIQFKGAPDYTQAELLRVAELEAGMAMTQSELQDHGQKLMDTGLFDNVTFQFAGGTLTYVLTPGVLVPVRLGNLPLASGKELDAALRERVPLYRGKVPQDGAVTQAVGHALEAMLAAKGMQATVQATPSTGANQQIGVMNYAITQPPVRVGAINVVGASAQMQAKVTQLAQSVTKSGYDTEYAAENVEHAFASLYTDEGYAVAKVHAEQVGSPVASSEAIDVPFNVTVEEGRHYKLGTIRLPGGEPLDLAELNKAAEISSTATEKLTLAEGVTVRTALQYVAGQYKSTGHMECKVSPHAELDDATGVANYRIEVDPGPVYTMGKLTIENGADDLRAAMLAAWKLPEGTVFNQNAIAEYFRKQGNTPLGRTFASVNCRSTLTMNPETHTVDVALRLEKKP